ncbi:SRPBCC family protein, partial [Streptomyces sp. NPDC059063]
MEHEVFVPVPEAPLRAALADPERVAGAVPGLQRDAAPDAGAPPVAGRLKVRVGGHTITYRGVLSVAARGDGAYALNGEGSEVRGSGVVSFALLLRLAPAAEGGTRVTFTGTASGDGRVADVVGDSPQAVDAAVRRLLGRFAEGLAAGAAADAAVSIFETEVPPPSLDPLADDDGSDGMGSGE